jgi:hypothetical protein
LIERGSQVVEGICCGKPQIAGQWLRKFEGCPEILRCGSIFGMIRMRSSPSRVLWVARKSAMCLLARSIFRRGPSKGSA